MLILQRLKDAIKSQEAKGEQIWELLLKHLTFDDDDEDLQGLIKPKREIEYVMDFL